MASRAPSPARRAALRVIRRVAEQGAFADQALHSEAAGLDPRERALARQLAFGAIQRRRTLDHVVGELTGGRRKLDPPVRAALHLGLVQLLFLDGIPDHAAVAETVELAKRNRGAGLVNAVLRRATREGRAVVEAIDDEAVRHSIPDWLASLWRDAYGADTSSALMRRANEPLELALRVNRLKATPEEVAAAVGGRAVAAVGGRAVGEAVGGDGGATAAEAPAAAAAAETPDAVVVDGPLDAHAHPLWHAGAYMPQSRSSQRVAPLTGAQPGERVLDLCSAPGGKATHLAALMRNEGEVVAVERDPDRADALRATVERMGATIVDVHVADAADPRTDGPFDRVLVDPPCSGLGTLQSKPDLRWRMTPERIAGLVAEQRRILAAAAAAVRPGGVVVWSTCTLNPAENEELLRDLDRFTVTERLVLMPHETGSAGFQLTRLESAA
ncbi:MAG TPA: 16S rRNA (cytosine(967)-C(5))-methyltransferase RsmB [Solirubrobacteraceae bacterium]|jgi:16S rRNA (cytosine967-C5)-methyltransferase|nr:16S rRNA (cytosine(967)-C(5))-methyltransferase RsmB [Solirubrobacteraceae bacterium]